ncbi:MAG: hypothetical protein FWF57_02800 [Defluviitaleaceae bacterium]|nr:hypothetical protein [Defluviitaleaceae bacterium]
MRKHDPYRLTKGKFIKIEEYKNFDLYEYIVSDIPLFKVSFTTIQFLEQYSRNPSLFSVEDYVEAKFKELEKKAEQEQPKKVYNNSYFSLKYFKK